MYTQISISLSNEQIAEIDKYARVQSMSRSQFLRTVVQSTLDKISSGYSSYSSLRIDSYFMDSLEYEIIEKKSELKKLEYQRDLLKDKGLTND